MHFEQVTYKRNFRISAIDQYLYETIETKVVFNKSEKANEAFDMAKAFVLEQGSKVTHDPFYSPTENVEEPFPIKVQKSTIETTVNYLIKDIESCQEIKVLESYKIIAKSKPELQEAYDTKFNQLKSI